MHGWLKAIHHMSLSDKHCTAMLTRTLRKNDNCVTLFLNYTAA